MHSTYTKAPGFALARAVLTLVGGASAAFGVCGWIVPELPLTEIPWAALVLAGLTALSAAVVPVSCEIIGRSVWSICFIPAVLVFGGMNAFSFHHAVDALIEQPRREAHHADVVAPLETKLATASDAVAAHKPPVFPDSMGPKNVATRMDSWERAHAPLLKAEADAGAALKAAPAYAPLVDDTLVWIVAALIDGSLALGLAGVTLITGAIRKQMEAEQAKAERKAKREASTKARAAAIPAQGFKPYLAVANDK